jgi:phage tail tape-measure protein
LGSAVLDSGANALKENGYETAGAVASTASGALSGASTGAMLGSLFGPGGAAVGAIGGALVGGLTTAWSEYQKSESADALADADANAVNESNRYQSQSLDEQRAMARELRQLREDIGYGNAISARHVSVQETGNRQLANMQYGAQ